MNFYFHSESIQLRKRDSNPRGKLQELMRLPRYHLRTFRNNLTVGYLPFFVSRGIRIRTLTDWFWRPPNTTYVYLLCVPKVGLEPTASRVSDGCANQLRHLGLLQPSSLVPKVGLEPTTSRI